MELSSCSSDKFSWETSSNKTNMPTRSSFVLFLRSCLQMIQPSVHAQSHNSFPMKFILDKNHVKEKLWFWRTHIIRMQKTRFMTALQDFGFDLSRGKNSGQKNPAYFCVCYIKLKVHRILREHSLEIYSKSTVLEYIPARTNFIIALVPLHRVNYSRRPCSA